MRNSTLFTVAAFCVVCAMSLSAHGAIVIEVTQNASPAAGLNSFTLTAVGDAGEIIQAIAGINVIGPTHNVTPFSKDPMTHIGMWADPGVFGDPAWAVYDTHLLIDLNDGDTVVGALGNPLDETNDGSDPAVIGPLFMPGFEAFPATVGLGDFGLQGDADQFTLTIAGAGNVIPFLQVVLPAGGIATLTGLTIYDDAGMPTLIGDTVIPEPSTFAILGIALVGLCAFRRKR